MEDARMGRQLRRVVVIVAAVSFLAGACGGGGSSSSANRASTNSPFDPAPSAGSNVVPTQPGNYNYSPSVMEDGNVIKFWWCSAVPSQATDHIWYEEYDKSTKAYSHLQSVLAPGVNRTDWDTFGACHPTVIRGSWSGGPGGQNFSYAMYYVSTNTSLGGGSGNSIGVVFSTDGIAWVGQHASYNPIIRQRVPNVKGSYGAGLPAAWSNGGSSVTLFWTDTTAQAHGTGFAPRVFIAVAKDGIHIPTPTRTVSQDGAPAFWKNDFAFDDSANPPMVYSAQAIEFRPAVPAPGKNETFNFGLYRIPKDQFLAGTGHWEQLGVIDTNLTGLPLNFEPGLLRTPPGGFAGDVTKDGIPAYFGGGGQTPDTWGLRSVILKSSPKTLLFRQYSMKPSGGSVSYWATTGFVPPSFRRPASPIDLGYLDLNPQSADEVPLYGCQSGPLKVTAPGELTDATADRFVSLEASCGGTNVLGTNGYLFPQAPAGTPVQALYSCRPDPSSHFVSRDAKCNGQASGELLGYARTQP
jgi:hypothetical protein